MKQIFKLYLLSLILISCNSGNSQKEDTEVDRDKKYLFIEVTGTNSLGVYRTKIDTTEIVSKNDSLAYLKAFEKACVSQQASRIATEELKKIMGTKADDETQYGFRLLDEDAKEVKHVVPDSILIRIQERIFSITTE